MVFQGIQDFEANAKARQADDAEKALRKAKRRRF